MAENLEKVTERTYVRIAKRILQTEELNPGLLYMLSETDKYCDIQDNYCGRQVVGLIIAQWRMQVSV